MVKIMSLSVDDIASAIHSLEIYRTSIMETQHGNFPETDGGNRKITILKSGVDLLQRVVSQTWVAPVNPG